MIDIEHSFTVLRSFAKGWNGYDADPPSKEALGITYSLLENFKAYEKYLVRIAASTIGGVGITYLKNNRRIYVEIYNSSFIYALFSDGINEPNVKEIRKNDTSIFNYLERI